MPLIGLNWLMICWAFSGLLQKSEADCFSRNDSRCFFLPRMSKRVPQEAQTVGKVLHLFFGFRVHRAHPGEVRQNHPFQPAVIPPACSIRKILGLAPGQSNWPNPMTGSGSPRKVVPKDFGQSHPPIWRRETRSCKVIPSGASRIGQNRKSRGYQT